MYLAKLLPRRWLIRHQLFFCAMRSCSKKEKQKKKTGRCWGKTRYKKRSDKLEPAGKVTRIKESNMNNEKDEDRTKLHITSSFLAFTLLSLIPEKKMLGPIKSCALTQLITLSRKVNWWTQGNIGTHELHAVIGNKWCSLHDRILTIYWRKKKKKQCFWNLRQHTLNTCRCTISGRCKVRRN